MPRRKSRKRGFGDKNAIRHHKREPAGDGCEEYEVEEIVDERIDTETGQHQYLVQWKDTWERAAQYKGNVIAEECVVEVGTQAVPRDDRVLLIKGERTNPKTGIAECLVRWKATWEPATALEDNLALDKWEEGRKVPVARKHQTAGAEVAMKKRRRTQGIRL